MRPKSLILLAMALGCGLVAAVGINQILARPATEVQTVGIVVAKREIQKGDLVKPDDIRLQEWHVDSLPEGAIQKIEDLADRRVKSLIVPGEAILSSKLIDGRTSGSDQIPAGLKAIAVKVTKDSAVGGLILPGDNVDVLLFVEANPSRGIAQTQSTVLLRNVKVHAVDDRTEHEVGENSIVGTTVSLLVTPKDATKLALASEVGNIRLIARSSKQGDEEDDLLPGSITVGNLFEKSGVDSGHTQADPIPGITPLPPPGVGEDIKKGIGGLTDFLEKMKDARDLGPAQPKEQPWKMVVIEGTTTKELEFSKDARFGKVTGGVGGDLGGLGLPPNAGSSLEPELPDLPPVKLPEPEETETSN
jgi:pilus assembly protein CpaB